MLRNSKLIVLDEATSSVDPHTDSLIQKAIRSEGGLFADSTVMTIAHRLFSVIDYHKILVLDQGRIVEFGRPIDLLSKEKNDETAWFSRMVDEMGDEARNELIRLAKASVLPQDKV
jgi:ATP-binding cassette subfamily C (CFTR/MRP) protein 4